MDPIEEYIQRQDEAVRPRLNAVRDAIRGAIPEAEERISWSMPTYWKGRNIIHFAAGKFHIGIYPGPDAMEAFRDRLTEYKTSKGAVQLPNGKALPLPLIAEMARWSYAWNAEGGQLDRIRRVEKYERLFDEVRSQPDKRKIRLLEAYYTSGEWRQDYEADERGELPPDLKRGVLSQDALYDYLDSLKED